MADPQVIKGDVIILFYAGHRSWMMAPDDWPATDRMIEALCPSDEQTKDNNGGEIYGIPNHTINNPFVLLLSLTLVCSLPDCRRGYPGHKGCETPTIHRNMTHFINAPLTIKIPPSLDSYIWGTDIRTDVGALSIPIGFKHRIISSHVLLATCQHIPCGFFMDNLLKQLQLINLERVTHVDLLHQLPELINQKPQCEGENKARFLFGIYLIWWACICECIVLYDGCSWGVNIMIRVRPVLYYHVRLIIEHFAQWPWPWPEYFVAALFHPVIQIGCKMHPGI